jgi:CRP-like cAMP-binding protein
MPVKVWLPAAARGAANDCKLNAGAALFRLGDKPAGLVEVITGRVRLTCIDRSGREVILYSPSAGETLAGASLFSRAACRDHGGGRHRQPRRPAMAKAKGDFLMH